MLGGRKIGSMHTTRAVHGERVITQQHLQVEFDRAGTRVALATYETDEETRAGVPLGFESRTTMSGGENLVVGTVRDGRSIEVRRRVGGETQTRTLVWPAGALLAEGLRLAEARAGTAAGTRYTSLAFQPENLEAVAIDTVVGETARVDLPDGARVLTKIEQTIRLPDAPAHSTAWVDADQTVVKLIMPLLGYELTMLACSQKCAQAPNQSADILVHALMPAPRALSADERRRGLVLKLSASDHGEPLKFAQTDEQKVMPDGDGFEVTIVPVDGKPAEGKPDVADTRPNDWLQSSAPEIVALAKKGVGDARSPHEQMQQLEDFVRGYIRTKDLNVGYASALEVVRNPEGDCTEHAVLLAALGRARGIPARVVDGLVYVDHYAGSEHVFVPHAWVQAFVDGHWQSFDAALHGFDAGHLALSVGDGDPWRFFAGFNALGRMRVDAVEAIR
jgi:transglutaminase-like putative cysteine protease